MTTELRLNACIEHPANTNLETVLGVVVAELMKRLGLSGTWIDLEPYDADPSLTTYYLSGETDAMGQTRMLYLSKDKIAELPLNEHVPQ
jgi:hypothetical protein